MCVTGCGANVCTIVAFRKVVPCTPGCLLNAYRLVKLIKWGWSMFVTMFYQGAERLEDTPAGSQ